MDGLCNLGRLSQTVVMPREALAGPLVITIQYRTTSSMGLGAPAVGLGAVWRDDLPVGQPGFRTVRACLGPGQYAPASSTGAGVPTLLTLMPQSTNIGCPGATTELDVDHVDLVPADPGECPADGLAANGDAETTGGWTFSAGTTSVATIVDGVGSNNSRGVRLFLAQRCDDPVASDPVAIAATGTPAFELYDRTTSGVSPNVSLGGHTLPVPAGTGAGRTTRVCVPAAMRGGAYTFRAYLDGGNGTCGDALGFESIFDDVKLVDDPRCAGETLVDPGFESQLPLLGALSTAGKGTAQVVTGAGIPHAGNAALRLDESVTCYDGTWVAEVVAPPPVGTAGPALAFFYRAEPKNKTQFEVVTDTTVFTGTADNMWQQGLVCLDPKLVGRIQSVTFTRAFLSGACEVAMTTETAYVDDLALTTDPSCPP
jgi:hypothetical protein